MAFRVKVVVALVLLVNIGAGACGDDDYIVGVTDACSGGGCVRR